MAWFPMFVDLEGKNCLVAGGSTLAKHKAEALLSYGARVRVVAPSILPALAELPVECVRRAVTAEDVEGMTLVVDATGDTGVGELLADACTRAGIPVNVVDRPAYCSFIFPAVLRRGKLVAAVSSGGASPAAAAWARDQIGQALPEHFEEILDQMESLRPETRARMEQQKDRARFLKRCFACAMEKGSPLSQDELDSLWTEVL